MKNTDKYQFITFDELISVLETDKTDNSFKLAADNLLEALTDWPTEELKEPAEIVSELKKVIPNKLTYDNLDRYLNTLTVDKDAWKMESLNSLLELFDFDNNNSIDRTIELEEIVAKITEHYKK